MRKKKSANASTSNQKKPNTTVRVRFITDMISEESPAHYYAPEVFTFPSLRESFGMAACEAMASGTPVVASHVGGLSEIVDNPTQGFLVPPKDPDALREKIRFLLDNPDNARQMGHAGRQKILETFTWDKTAQAYEKIYSF